MTTKPRAPLNLAFPGKGSAAPRADVITGELPAAVQTSTEVSRPSRPASLAPKVRNDYAALTIRPGPERRKRLEEVSRSTGHSMQDILLHCFDGYFPPE